MPKVNFANKDNISIIAEFELRTFGNEAYSYEILEKMLDDNYKLKDNENIFVIKNEEEVIGYIIFHITDDFTDVYKIFIRENNRKKGLAISLLSEVEKIAKKYHSKKMMVEVRSKNMPAICLYNKFGFSKISDRKNYYFEPTDDALILEKILEV